MIHCEPRGLLAGWGDSPACFDFLLPRHWLGIFYYYYYYLFFYGARWRARLCVYRVLLEETDKRKKKSRSEHSRADQSHRWPVTGLLLVRQAKAINRQVDSLLGSAPLFVGPALASNRVVPVMADALPPSEFGYIHISMPTVGKRVHWERIYNI